MNMTSSHALLAQVARGLLRHGRERTNQTLGDRRAYVGLSDIGKGIECLRAAVAAKVIDRQPEDISRLFQDGDWDGIRAVLQHQLILQRGHWLEAGLESALRANGISLIPQLEIADHFDGTPIRAHLDFTIVRGGERPAVRVLELKSTERIPDVLYPAYEAQIHGQVGLLKERWEAPVFSVRDADGQVIVADQTFPAIVKTILGIDLPPAADSVDIEGWVLCLAMSDAKAFGPYRPDATMVGLCRKTAQAIWETAEQVRSGGIDLDSVAICPGFHPLCDWCPFALDCPKFVAQAIDDPEIDAGLHDLLALKEQYRRIEADLRDSERRIRAFWHRSECYTDWLQTGLFRFKNVLIAGRKTLDRAQLQNSLGSALGPDSADALIEAATVQGEPHERLYVSRL